MPKMLHAVKKGVELCTCRTDCKRCPYYGLSSEYNKWACTMALAVDTLYWLDELEGELKRHEKF